MTPLPVFMAPQGAPGRLTLQASAAVWEALARRLAGTDRGLAELVRRQAKGGGDAVRITFGESQARRILQLAGVSA